MSSQKMKAWKPTVNRQACQNESQLSTDKLAKLGAWEPTVHRQACQKESMEANCQQWREPKWGHGSQWSNRKVCYNII